MLRQEYPERRETISEARLLIYPLLIAFLGGLVLVSIYVFQIYIQGGYHSIKWMDRDGVVNMMEFGLRAFSPFNDAVWPGLCFFIGLVLFIRGIVQAVAAGKQVRLTGSFNGRGFALTCISLGILFIAALIWYLGWLEPGWVSVKTIATANGEVTVYRDPVWIRQLIAWKVISFLLGAAVIGVGILQLKRHTL